MRYVVHALLFAVILCLVTASAHDVSPESNRRVVNMEMVAQVEAWLSLLTEQQHKSACFSFKSDERMNWHFIPRERLGLSLKAMNLQQRRAAYALLQTGLSHQGYLKATTIMSLESVLRELEKDRPGNEDRRDPDKYWFSVLVLRQ
ncbi:MAG TPA: hypothetical protein DEB70_06175, partial [Planctomycetaceae bacterium]|nr:hypothetical protein [Planctomycetaceae bacterium]